VIKLPRTIRLDRSDAVIFTPAAEPGEWAVPGTFIFAGRDPEGLSRKEQIALRSGFLGIASFGWSTLVTVTLVRPQDRAEAVAVLAEQLVMAEDLCRGHAEGTLIALHRTAEDGGLRERFRTLKPRDETAFGAGYLGGHDRAFHFMETEEEDEGFDLSALAQEEAPR
jgi:hypothetical protein